MDGFRLITRTARPGRIPGPGRSGPDAGPVIRRAEFFRIFVFPARAGPVVFSDRNKHFLGQKMFSSFFHPN